MKKFIMKNKVLTLVLLISTILIIAGLYIRLNSVRTEKGLLEKYDLIGLDVTEIVTKLDIITNEDKGFKSSISATKLTISENGVELAYKVPNDLFYLSFAPYINSTHPCGTHSLATCRSELKNETFYITIKDSNGDLILQKEVTSMDNGFIGLWLPRDIEGTLQVEYNEMYIESEISTFSTDDTCLTEPLKLK